MEAEMEVMKQTLARDGLLDSDFDIQSYVMRGVTDDRSNDSRKKQGFDNARSGAGISGRPCRKPA